MLRHSFKALMISTLFVMQKIAIVLPFVDLKVVDSVG
jgi:hypothetical protein